LRRKPPGFEEGVILRRSLGWEGRGAVLEVPTSELLEIAVELQLRVPVSLWFH
jgi:hypothetical protein